ncbi:MAG: glycosyltransferase family 2 protein [Patescibacteria group bacterium]|nr:glycosyltransferase family 2 protein [Patescibacteria group bacterium]
MNNQDVKRVAIIAVLWKARRFLDAWIESLALLDYPREAVELVIVDNASTDGSRERILEIMQSPPQGLPKIHFMPMNTNLGFAGGNNRAIEYAMALPTGRQVQGFDYVYLINYDTRVEPDFLRHAVDAAESNQKIGSVQSLLALWPERGLINSSGNMIHYLGFGFCGGSRAARSERDFIGLPEIAYGSGAGVLYKIGALRDAGLFDEKLFAYHEDLDLGWRLRLGGFVNVLAPRSVVYHEYEFSRSISKYYWMERNRFILYFCDYKFLTQLVFLPAFLAMELGQFIFSIKSGWWREKLKAYLWMIAPWHWPYLFVKHARIARARSIGDKEVLRHFTGKIEYQEINNWALKIANPLFNLYFLIARLIIFW